MKPLKRTVYEYFLVVEGAGEFPIDMLRYDSAFPCDEADSAAIRDRRERRRVIVCRRGVNPDSGNAARWRSYGWPIIGVYVERYEALRAKGEVPR